MGGIKKKDIVLLVSLFVVLILVLIVVMGIMPALKNKKEQEANLNVAKTERSNIDSQRSALVIENNRLKKQIEELDKKIGNINDSNNNLLNNLYKVELTVDQATDKKDALQNYIYKNILQDLRDSGFDFVELSSESINVALYDKINVAEINIELKFSSYFDRFTLSDASKFDDFVYELTVEEKEKIGKNESETVKFTNLTLDDIEKLGGEFKVYKEAGIVMPVKNVYVPVFDGKIFKEYRDYYEKSRILLSMNKLSSIKENKIGGGEVEKYRIQTISINDDEKISEDDYVDIKIAKTSTVGAELVDAKRVLVSGFITFTTLFKIETK